jgi:hypothetical protein
VFPHACKLALEGIVAKRRRSAVSIRPVANHTPQSGLFGDK